MIRLAATTHKLQLVLSGAVTTNQLQVTAHYSDHTSTTYGGGLQRTTSNNTTDVDIVDAPGASTVRDIDYLSIYNADTVAATVTVKVDVSGTEHILVKQELIAGSTLEYVHGAGWHIAGASGGGVSDHGALTGLGDNDHPQYLLVADIDDVPVNGEVAQPISSNWAYDHEAAADPHPGYRLESADHNHQSTGAQGGQLDHGAALTGLGDDDHTQYVLNDGTRATTILAAASGDYVRIGGGATASELRFLEPSGSGSHYTAFKAQAQTGNVTYTLPAADGSADQYLKTNGSGALLWDTPAGGALFTHVAPVSLSGASQLWTGIPSGTQEVVVTVAAASFNGASVRPAFRIGPSGGVATSGYVGVQGNTSTTGTGAGDGSSTSISISSGGWAAADTFYIVLRLTLHDAANDIWMATFNARGINGGHFYNLTGIYYVDLSGPLERVQFLDVQSGNSFDAGTASIKYR